MKKVTVYTKDRGVRTLKAGITLAQYQVRYPSAIKVSKPSLRTMENWDREGFCKTLDGCRVEPDGRCSHGFNSWLLELGFI